MDLSRDACICLLPIHKMTIRPSIFVAITTSMYKATIRSHAQPTQQQTHRQHLEPGRYPSRLPTTMSTTTPTPRYKLIVFVPIAHASDVKTAIFATGAGTIGLYDNCCFTSYGTGEFTPNQYATPNIGEPGKAESVQEARLEIQCLGREQVEMAVRAIKR